MKTPHTTRRTRGKRDAPVRTRRLVWPERRPRGVTVIRLSQGFRVRSNFPASFLIYIRRAVRLVKTTGRHASNWCLTQRSTTAYYPIL